MHRRSWPKEADVAEINGRIDSGAKKKMRRLPAIVVLLGIVPRIVEIQFVTFITVAIVPYVLQSASSVTGRLFSRQLHPDSPTL